MDGLPGIRLHQGDDVTALLRLTGEQLGLSDPPLPYWAFPWPGGLAIARYLLDHPVEIEGRSVIDVGSGSGLCAIVAARCGASSVTAIDVDPCAEAAITLNAHANDVRVAARLDDVLDTDPPAVDVILAGDVWYEKSMASRLEPWLERATRQGSRVLIGDPGRAYLPPGLEPVARYVVVVSAEIDGATARPSTVYALRR